MVIDDLGKHISRQNKHKVIGGVMSGNVSESVDKPSELKIALDNRMFEIQMFWQRSNYFLVLITALGVGVFTIKSDGMALLIAVFAVFSSYYWYKTNLGSKFWQESWEVEVISLAASEQIASFNRSSSDIVDQVKVSLQSGWSIGGKNKIHRYIDRKIAEKPSVSYYMIMLSLTSTVLWVIVSIVYFVSWLNSFSLNKIYAGIMLAAS